MATTDNIIGDTLMGASEAADIEPPLDTSWIDSLKKAESIYNDFYKEPVTSIKLFFLYVNSNCRVDLNFISIKNH